MTPLGELVAAIDARRPVVLATIVDTERSVPRRPGAKMLVFADGVCVGTVGGGEMEARVREEALGCLRSKATRHVSYTLLDPSTGDPGVCGGRVEVFLEPFMPPTQLLVIGAGHVGRCVVELARWLELDVLVWDDRPEVLGELEGDAGALYSGPITEVASRVDAGTAVVLLTRNVALDVEVLPTLLGTETPMVGVMGSARRWQTTRALLADAGVDEAALAKIRTPVGLEIGAETPKEIAVAILAQIIGEDV